MRKYEQCNAKFFTNRNLVNSPQCADPLLRIRYGPLQDDICTRATHDMRVYTWLCALEMVWIDGWRIVVESEWLLFGWGAMVIASLAWMYNKSQERHMFQKFAAPRQQEAGDGFYLIKGRRH